MITAEKMRELRSRIRAGAVFCRECFPPARLCFAWGNLRFSQKRRGTAHPLRLLTSRSQLRVDSTAFHPGVFLGIQPDGTVLIVAASHGNGKWSAHQPAAHRGGRTRCRLVARHCCPGRWRRTYGSQDTDGSHSVREFFDTLREAGATARLMLVRAAAQQWGVPEPSNAWPILRTLSLTRLQPHDRAMEPGSLAAKQPVPKKEELN